MKFKTFLAGCLGGLLSLNSCTNSPDMTDYAAYVNPFIGTGGHGHTFPGAIVPPWHDFSQPRHPHRWVGCLLGILLRRFHHQRILTHPFERNRLLRLWRCTTDAYGGRTKVPPHRFTEPADGLCFCLFTSK